MHKLTAQVAVEAIINDPDAYERLVQLQVYQDALEAGVSKFYLDAMVQQSLVLNQSQVNKWVGK